MIIQLSIMNLGKIAHQKIVKTSVVRFTGNVSGKKNHISNTDIEKSENFHSFAPSAMT